MPDRYKWFLLFLAVTASCATAGLLYSLPTVGIYDLAYVIRGGLEYLIVVTSTFGGLVAGILWCRMMHVAIGCGGAGLDKSLAWGTAWGFIAGSLGAQVAVLLHFSVALPAYIVTLPPDHCFQAPEIVVLTLGRLVIWLFHGVRAGSLIGFLGGGLAYLLFGRGRQEPFVAAKATQQ